jgi:hypothetical protein
VAIRILVGRVDNRALEKLIPGSGRHRTILIPILAPSHENRVSDAVGEAGTPCARHNRTHLVWEASLDGSHDPTLASSAAHAPGLSLRSPRSLR